MTYKRLEEAIKEARRFIKTAEAAQSRIADGKYPLPRDKQQTALVGGSRETAAARRASMDLTRALTDLRGS